MQSTYIATFMQITLIMRHWITQKRNRKHFRLHLIYVFQVDAISRTNRRHLEKYIWTNNTCVNNLDGWELKFPKLQFICFEKIKINGWEWASFKILKQKKRGKGIYLVRSMSNELACIFIVTIGNEIDRNNWLWEKCKTLGLENC